VVAHTFQPSHSELRGLSLCAGYAGLDLGLHIAEPNYRTVGYVEREAHAAATLVARMADKALAQAPIWDDLKSFDGKPWRNRIHIVTAGYPCQPFSICGKRQGEADPRHLWPDVARIVREVAPEWVFAENVEGHLDLGFADVAAELQNMGYRCKAGLFTAREVGASHRRRRLFILANADSKRRRLFSRHDDQRRQYSASVTVRHFADELRSIRPQQHVEMLDNSLEDVAGAGLDTGRCNNSIFAPGPGELSQWFRLLSVEPSLQPALLRNDDGLADWMERTRGAGNGVCSLAAARAWSVLKTDFDVDRCEGF
jgi:DNA (cytosine-5)-methyltransferase 1